MSEAKPRISRQDLFHSPGNFLAFGFGAGLAPVAPGTIGTVVAIPLYLALVLFDPFLYTGIVVMSFIAGISLCRHAAESLSLNRQVGHDHPGIVWDEMVGFWITLYLIPFSWTAVILGFVLFRLFDIIKPWPIRLIDREVEGGLGIMLDDVLAGVFANIVLRLILLYLPV